MLPGIAVIRPDHDHCFFNATCMSPKPVGVGISIDFQDICMLADHRKRLPAKKAACPGRNAPIVPRRIRLNGWIPDGVEASAMGSERERRRIGRRP